MNRSRNATHFCDGRMRLMFNRGGSTPDVKRLEVAAAAIREPVLE